MLSDTCPEYVIHVAESVIQVKRWCTRNEACERRELLVVMASFREIMIALWIRSHATYMYTASQITQSPAFAFRLPDHTYSLRQLLLSAAFTHRGFNHQPRCRTQGTARFRSQLAILVPIVTLHVLQGRPSNGRPSRFVMLVSSAVEE